MRTNELRLGNLFLDKFNNVCEIEWIAKESVSVKTKELDRNYSQGFLISQINQIPLTEDWLVRCGFKYVTMGIFKLGEFTVTKWSGEVCEYKAWTANGIEKECVQLPYVHNLQNLYYELKKEELTIKTE